MSCIAVAGASSGLTAGSASAAAAIPNDAAGNVAKYVRVAAKGNIYVRPTQSGGTVTTGNGVLVTISDALLLNVSGFTHIAHIRDGASDVGFTITPIEMR